MKENQSGRDKDELKDLLAKYQSLKHGQPNSFLEEESFEMIIDYYDEKEDMSAALEAVEYGILQYPYSSLLLVKKADLFIATRKYTDALDLLEKVELLDRKDVNVFILKTDAYLALDQQKKAANILEEAITIFEGEEKIDLLFELADVYDDYEQFEKVFNCLCLILDQDPVNEEALYKICFWTDFTGRNEESIKLHQRIIEEHPFTELAWFNLGAAYQGIKLYEKAVDAYLYALAIDEKFDYAYRNLGDAYLRMRKYREAIEALQKVLELSRPEDVIYEAIGHAYDKLKNYAQARFNYRKASHLNPDDSHLYYKIACTYMNEQYWESGLKNLESAMRIQRSQPEYNFAMGKCYSELGKTKEAVIYFSNFIKSRPKSIKGWKELIKCLYKAEFYDEALTQVFNAEKNTSENALIAFYKCSILFASEKSTRALLTLENALEKFPGKLKYLLELNPALLQNQQVVDLISKAKRNNSSR